MDGFRAWLAESRIEPGLARMTALSALLHLLGAALLLVYGTLGAAREPEPVAYTVKIVDPASLGGRLPKAAPEKGPEKPEPPEKAPPAPEPEPEPEAVAVPDRKEKPEPKKEEAKKPEPAPTKKPEPTRKPASEKKPPPKEKAKPKATPKPSGPSPEEVARRERDRKIQEAIERLEQRSGAENDDAPIGSGGEGRGGGTLTGLDFILYKNRVEGIIRENWAWVGSNPDLTVRVRFRIEADGAVREVRLVSPSGDRTFDESVVRAVHAASPLPAPPDQYREAFSDYVLEFVSGELSG